ncbi:hypothetical protein Cni_G25737 [Canna indica]|uniref:Cyclin N-terminal domain-containing protein n=1 Tax=Canna indica TaxID=4628 RepID=A0AAQ3QMP8_9LILI|nr:hypothetical protein Cni_G25737 [Canna indica]
MVEPRWGQGGEWAEDRIWAVKLLSIACLSLAAEMEECRVPPLSMFQFRDYRFSSETIQRVELFALSTLQWMMFTVTPFPYLSSLAVKFAEDGSNKDLI